MMNEQSLKKRATMKRALTDNALGYLGSGHKMSVNICL